MLVEKGIFNEFSYDSNENLVLIHSTDYIQEAYGLSDENMDILKQIVNISEMSSHPSLISQSQRIGFSSGSSWVKMTLSKNEVQASLFAAGAVGPAAVEAAIIAWAFIGGGPIAGIATSVVAILGAGSFVAVANNGVKAVKAKKGMYIKAGLDGFIPYLESGVL